MRPLISIIVPVYNVEKYLSRCINSILGQSFTDYELILIDDGSTDKSGNICDEFAKKDQRIQVRHFKNNGVSSARNTGIKISKGEWLFFLDSDDTLEPESLNSINSQLNKYKNIDMLVGSFRYINNNQIVNAYNANSYQDGIDVMHEYGLWNIKICMGSFVVKKEQVENNHIIFNTETKYGEDVEFINYCLLNSYKVKVTSQCLFNYTIHNNSAISKVGFDRYDCYKARKRILKYVQKNFPNNKELETLYSFNLLPEAIIDTTYLLCRNRINIFKIIKFLNNNKYYDVINHAKDNDNTPLELSRKINKFISRPILTWFECIILTYYYSLRGNLGLLKKRLFR